MEGCGALMEQPSHREGSNLAWIWCKFTIFLLITWQETASEVPKFTSHSFNSGISSRVHRNYHQTQTRLLPFYQFPGRQRCVETDLAVSEVWSRRVGALRLHPTGWSRRDTIWQVPEKDGKGLRESLQHKSEPAFLFFFLFNSYIEMEFLKNVHLTCPFEGFRAFTDTCNQHSQFWNIFIPSKLNPEPSAVVRDHVWDSHKCGVMQGGTLALDPSGPVYWSGLSEQKILHQCCSFRSLILVDLNMDPKVVHSEQIITARVAFSWCRGRDSSLRESRMLGRICRLRPAPLPWEGSGDSLSLWLWEEICDCPHPPSYIRDQSITWILNTEG